MYVNVMFDSPIVLPSATCRTIRLFIVRLEVLILCFEDSHSDCCLPICQSAFNISSMALLFYVFVTVRFYCISINLEIYCLYCIYCIYYIYCIHSTVSTTVNWSIHLSIDRSIYLSMFISFYPSIHPSILWATRHWKTQCFATCLRFRARWSSFFLPSLLWLFLLSDLLSTGSSSFTVLTTVAASVHKSEIWLLNFLRLYWWFIVKLYSILHLYTLYIPNYCWLTSPHFPTMYITWRFTLVHATQLEYSPATHVPWPKVRLYHHKCGWSSIHSWEFKLYSISLRSIPNYGMDDH